MHLWKSLTALLGLGLAVLVLGAFLSPASASDGGRDGVTVLLEGHPAPTVPDCLGVLGELAVTPSAGGIAACQVVGEMCATDCSGEEGPQIGPAPEDSQLTQCHRCNQCTGGRDRPVARL